jgi:hypothetical protein
MSAGDKRKPDTESEELKAHRRKLFIRYFANEQKLGELRREIIRLTRECSDLAEEVQAQSGKGPFKFDGRRYMVIERRPRTNQPEDTPSTFWLQGPRDDGEEV